MGTLEVYLKRDIFDWYSAGKEYELRANRGRFSSDRLVEGMEVELYRGNTGVSRVGRIGGVAVGSLDEVLAQVPFEKIAPFVDSCGELKRIAESLMGRCDSYVAFQILFNDSTGE